MQRVATPPKLCVPTLTLLAVREPQRRPKRPSSRRAMSAQQKAALMMDLEHGGHWGASWSLFPSSAYGQANSQALRVLQRNVRRWLGRRWRVQQKARRQIAAFTIQVPPVLVLQCDASGALTNALCAAAEVFRQFDAQV